MDFLQAYSAAAFSMFECRPNRREAGCLRRDDRLLIVLGYKAPRFLPDARQPAAH